MENKLNQSTVLEFQNLKDMYNLDLSTMSAAVELISSYSSRLQIKPFACRFSLWIASFQLLLPAMDGSIVQGSGITLNQVLPKEYDEFFSLSEEMLMNPRVQPGTKLSYMKFEASFTLHKMFYQKMDQLFNNLQFTDVVKDFDRLVKNIAWLLFVSTMKNIITSNDVVELTCLMVSMMHLIISQSIQYAQVSFGFSEIKKIQTQNLEAFQKDLLNYLLFHFKIKDLEMFTTINGQFQGCFNEMLRLQQLKSLKTQQSTNSILSGSIINSNLQRLDNYYSATLSFDELDSRIIMNEKITQQTPRKINLQIQNPVLVPQKLKMRELEQQGNLMKFQRLLNYENENNAGRSSGLHEIRLPSKTIMSPYAQQTVIATPMTAAMEMYNWLHEKNSTLKKFFKNFQFSLATAAAELYEYLPNLTKIHDQSMIDNLFIQTFELVKSNGLLEAAQNKRQLYWSFFIRILDLYLSKRVNLVLLKEEEAQQILVVSIECVNVILGQKIKNFEQLIRLCDVPYYQVFKLNIMKVWIKLDFLLNNLDLKCPQQLKEHILDQESMFITYYVWSSDKQSDLLNYINKLSAREDQLESLQFQRIFKRVLHYCAYQIQILSEYLNLNEHLSEAIWTITKYIISEKTNILCQRSLDQIVLSSIYAILKIVGNPCKFQVIINAYESTNSHFSKQFIKNIVCNVYLSNTNRGDIVSFYNQVFIPQIKSFLLTISQTLKQNRPNLQNLPQSFGQNFAINQQILQSPLKSILSSKPAQKLPVSMTPATKLLYAYTESPLLKTDWNQVDEKEKENQPQNIVKHTRVEQIQDTADFITKKFQQIKQKIPTHPLPPQSTRNQQQFSIMNNGTPKILNHSRNGSFFHPQNTSNNGSTLQEKTQENNNSLNYCKLLNFET